MLKTLLRMLSERNSSDTVYNQYRNTNVLNNLRLYLEWVLKHNHSILMIGEAPGYRGCRLTGIPFTSGEVIKNAQHKIFSGIGDRIRLSHIVSETTASILWDFLGRDKLVPVLWNAFPFHPHISGVLESNRSPSAIEIEEGKQYLQIIYKLFKPNKLCSLGRVGEKILRELFPDKQITYIRHPSHGGKKEFEKGIKAVVELA